MYNKVQVQATSKSIRETYYLKLRHIFLHIDNADGACLVTDETNQILHVILNFWHHSLIRSLIIISLSNVGTSHTFLSDMDLAFKMLCFFWPKTMSNTYIIFWNQGRTPYILTYDHNTFSWWPLLPWSQLISWSSLLSWWSKPGEDASLLLSRGKRDTDCRMHRWPCQQIKHRWSCQQIKL